jgi:hypothetical protein
MLTRIVCGAAPPALQHGTLECGLTFTATQLPRRHLMTALPAAQVLHRSHGDAASATAAAVVRLADACATLLIKFYIA